MLHSEPEGFLATPATGQGKPVLVLHAWWGLNDTIKAFCTQLAEAGFTAFAPDLYHGKVTDTLDGAETLADGVFGNPDRTRADVVDAADYLIERAGQPGGGLAVMGFSLGAYFALDLSVAAPKHTRAVIVFYGTRPGDYSRSRAAYLGHFAEADEFEPSATVNELEESLRDAGRPVTFYRYSGTGHWFCEPDRAQAYNPAAANLAWTRTLDFLRNPATR